jgi:hypothetical protein
VGNKGKIQHLAQDTERKQTKYKKINKIKMYSTQIHVIHNLIDRRNETVLCHDYYIYYV